MLWMVVRWMKGSFFSEDLDNRYRFHIIQNFDLLK
jgi:hypothetical protein